MDSPARVVVAARGWKLYNAFMLDDADTPVDPDTYRDRLGSLFDCIRRHSAGDPELTSRLRLEPVVVGVDVSAMTNAVAAGTILSLSTVPPPPPPPPPTRPAA